LGADALGDKALDKAKALGLYTSLLQRNPDFPTGTVDVSFDEHHNPDYMINPDVAYDHIKLTDALLHAATDVECFCFGTLIQRAPVSRETLFRLVDAMPNAIKFLDINLRKECFTKETILFSLEQANILKLNDDEVHQLENILGFASDSYSAFCEKMLAEFHLEYVLVTFGERGAFARSTHGEEVYMPGYKIKLADSLGAGDAFSAAFVHSLLNGSSLHVACELGNALGALVATTHGATAVVAKKQIAAFLQSPAERVYHPEFR
jgi:fructokinase